MNKQEKEELANQLNSRLRNCPSDSWDKGYNEGLMNAVIVVRNMHTADEPQKGKVPEEFDEWYQQIKQKWEFSEMIARRFALWKICQFGFGHDFEDVSHERTSLDLSRWVSGHREDAIYAVLNGYEVEEERKYCVNIGGLYLKEPLGDTNDFTINMTWNKDCAYLFDSWNMAREHTSKLGGTVEKVGE